MKKELQRLKTLIFQVRGRQVMLDEDLAEIYQVETKVFNQAVKRNVDRFPSEFMFQLTEEEYKSLRSQIVTSKSGLSPSKPWCYCCLLILIFLSAAGVCRKRSLTAHTECTAGRVRGTINRVAKR